MKINTVIQTDEGKVHFQGELTQQESDLVVEVGLGMLLARGAIPHLMQKAMEAKALEETPAEQPALILPPNTKLQ